MKTDFEYDIDHIIYGFNEDENKCTKTDLEDDRNDVIFGLNKGKRKYTKYDPEDRSSYMDDAETTESVFLDKYGIKGTTLRLPFIRNPDKDIRKTARDFICTEPNHLDWYGDSKLQETSYHISMSKFGIPPQFEMTSNLADHYYYDSDFQIEKRRTMLLYWPRYAKNVIRIGKIVYAMEGVWIATSEEVLRQYHGLYVTKKRENLPPSNKNKRVNFALDLREYRQLHIEYPPENKSIIEKIRTLPIARPLSFSERMDEIKVMKQKVPSEGHMLDWLKNKLQEMEY